MSHDRSDQQPAAQQPDRPTGAVADFYDALSPYYHLIYQDWAASVERQGGQLDALIRERWGDHVHDVLDAACGIGTQTLGLAARGYRVSASDLSAAALERARQNAAQRGLSIEFAIDDMRFLSAHAHRTFDLVIACDNAIPHLAADGEIRAALTAFRDRLRPGGGCILSVRDYAAMDLTGTRLVPFGVRKEESTRYVVFQVWECDDTGYDLHFYFVEDADGAQPVTHVMRSRYYAVTIERIVQLLEEVGFHDVERVDDRFFQPLVIGTRP
jgi:SAM-dependent methyltransferase